MAGSDDGARQVLPEDWRRRKVVRVRRPAWAGKDTQQAAARSAAAAVSDGPKRPS